MNQQIMEYLGSQPPFEKWWFLLGDDQPLLEKLRIPKPTYRKWWSRTSGEDATQLLYVILCIHSVNEFVSN